MDLVTGWTGHDACALQAALRMSNEAFAEHLGIAVRTVAGWHQKPGLRPRPEMQQVLDAALARAPAAAAERFAVLTGEPARAVSARTDDDGAAADAEHRLITDPNISGALSRLDQLAAWEPGTARRTVAARLAGLDRRDLLDRASRRSRIGRDDVADALGGYYRCQAGEHGRYRARCGHDGPEIVTSVLTCPDWLDLDCPLTFGHDRLTHAGPAARADVPLDAAAADAAAQRLAETLVAGTRFVDMPLYRLTGIRVGKGEIGGSLGITPFASYALTLDLLEGELADALAAGIPPEPGSLPLRDRYLPDLASVLGVAGGCAPAGRWPCARSPARPTRTGGLPITRSWCKSVPVAWSTPRGSWRSSRRASTSRWPISAVTRRSRRRCAGRWRRNCSAARTSTTRSASSTPPTRCTRRACPRPCAGCSRRIPARSGWNARGSASTWSAAISSSPA